MKKTPLIFKISFILISSFSIAFLPTFLITSCYSNANNNNNNNNNNTQPNDKLPGNENDKPNEQLPPSDTNKPGQNNPIVPSDKYDIDDSYIKNNANVVDDPGKYSLATPGSGGKDSINVAFSPPKSTPSEGVKENAISENNFLRNELDIKSAKKTFSLVFVDNSLGTTLGTGWILDYKLTENGSYPLTWYIATNAHVAQNLKVNNDIISPDRYNGPGNDFYDTNHLQLSRLNDFSLNKKLDPTNPFLNEGTYTYARIDSNDGKNLKTVFIGNDYLKTKPEMYSNSGMWKDVEEYIDFAVIEVTFPNEIIAKKMTNEYYSDTSLQFKYKKESLVNNQNYINENKFIELGYPAITDKDPINKVASLTINRSENQQTKNKDNTLGTSPYYKTFKDIDGPFDASLGFSYFGYDYRYADPSFVQAFLRRRYVSWGLMYQVNYGNLGAGSSGSMLIDSNGYTWGIHLAADPTASLGFSQALYCEGFNYQGKYGRYNLQGYDLIEGGFPNQKKSYKDGLKILYGKNPNFKTNIFKNGLN